ncbi:hypothetical protein [Candidatus Sororendozoicomonas aggregata]|uniref:hypothetical protein n=1 Tax=Candidatus Sororendozoicomonas aggregata TaxID=3073239 RepID=UPI002ED66349
MKSTRNYSQHFHALQQRYLDNLDRSCAFFEDSLSFMQTGCLDHKSFDAVKLEATNLVGSGKSYGFACISDAADLLLTMLKHLKARYGNDIALPIEEQEHLAVLTLAMLVVIRKVRAGEIMPEKLQAQSLFFDPPVKSRLNHLANPTPSGQTASPSDPPLKANKRRFWHWLTRSR